MIIILIILIILFTVCLYNFLCNKLDLFNMNDSNNYDLYTNVDHYRIGDLLRGYGKSPMKGNDKSINLEDGILKFHPNTLAAKYILNNKSNEINNFKLLNSFIPTHNYKNVCILHLRIGDILDDKHYNNNKELIMKKFYNNIPDDNSEYSEKLIPNWYLKSQDYYNNKIDILKKNNVKNIIIIAGSHINIGNYELSSYLINLIKNLFEKNNFNVTLRLAKHPDDDIILVANSKFFIPSNGGYSNLLTNISKSNNNNVL